MTSAQLDAIVAFFTAPFVGFMTSVFLIALVGEWLAARPRKAPKQYLNQIYDWKESGL